MARGRVQVDDLSLPEPIRPAPLQSDTFARPAQAPINNDLERLANSLGAFRQGVMSLQPRMEKQAQDDRMRQYNEWLSYRNDDQRLNEIHSGKAPWLTDPYVGHIARGDYGKAMAMRMAREIEGEISENKIPFGTGKFNVDQYVIDKASAYVEQVNGSKESMQTFRQGLDRVRKHLQEKHEEARGKIAVQFFEAKAFDEFLNFIKEGAKNQHTPERTLDFVRKAYKDLGARVGGGSLGLKYGRMDQIALEAIHEAAKDERLATFAVKMLNVERQDPGTGMRLGTLGSIKAHRDKITSIRETAVKTLATKSERELRQRIAQQDRQLLMRRDTSFGAITDFRGNVEIEMDGRKLAVKEISIDGKTRQNAAIDAFTKQVLTSVKDPGQQEQMLFEYIHKNGFAVPQWMGMLNSAYAGLGMLTNSKDLPTAIQNVQQAGRLYEMLANGGYAGLQKHLSKDVTEFFDSYIIAKNEIFYDQDPAAAATAVVQAWSDRRTMQDPNAESRRMQQIEDAINRLDGVPSEFALFTKGGLFGGFGIGRGHVMNQGTLRSTVRDLANGFIRYTGISADQAVKAAVDRIQKNAVYVNGMMIYGVNGLSKGDDVHFNSIIQKRVLDDVALKDLMKSRGVTSPNQLRPVGGPHGVFMLVDENNEPVMAPPGDDGGPAKPVLITTGDIAQERNRVEAAKYKAAQDLTAGKLARDRNVPASQKPKRKGSEAEPHFQEKDAMPGEYWVQEGFIYNYLMKRTTTGSKRVKQLPK